MGKFADLLKDILKDVDLGDVGRDVVNDLALSEQGEHSARKAGLKPGSTEEAMFFTAWMGGAATALEQEGHKERAISILKHANGASKAFIEQKMGIPSEIQPLVAAVIQIAKKHGVKAHLKPVDKSSRVGVDIVLAGLGEECPQELEDAITRLKEATVKTGGEAVQRKHITTLSEASGVYNSKTGEFSGDDLPDFVKDFVRGLAEHEENTGPGSI